MAQARKLQTNDRSRQTPLTMRVKRTRYERVYEVEEIRQLGPESAVVVGRPVFKGGTRGRPRTIGHLVFD